MSQYYTSVTSVKMNLNGLKLELTVLIPEISSVNMKLERRTVSNVLDVTQIDSCFLNIRKYSKLTR